MDADADLHPRNAGKRRITFDNGRYETVYAVEVDHESGRWEQIWVLRSSEMADRVVDALARTPEPQGEAALTAALGLIAAVEKACPVCRGEGWTVEADPSDDTGQTPMQVQCWDAEHVVILSAPPLALRARTEAPPARITELEAIDRLLAVEHREDDQPCACDACMSYGAEDVGADWYRIPPANRIAMRILDAVDDRLAPLARAFNDHAVALADATEAPGLPLAALTAVLEAVETEWYNGNVDEGARDRIVRAARLRATASDRGETDGE